MAVALWTSAACANPIIAEWFYVDFDPPNRLHRIDPVPNSVVDAYVMIDLSMSSVEQFPQEPRWIVDCSDPAQQFTYCVWSHGGVDKEPLSGDCGGSFVRELTWSAIRALYR